MRPLLLLCLALPACDDGGSADPVETTDAQVDAQVDAAPELSALESALAGFQPERMKADVDFLAADEQGGRVPGTPGHQRSRAYLVEQMEASGIEPFGDMGGWYHVYERADRDDRFTVVEGEVVQAQSDAGCNVVGIVRAPAPTDRYIVYMGHYDHLGVDETGDPFNGAFDNATGAALGVELARVIIEHEARPAADLIIILTDDEEGGLKGAEQWIADPPVPKEQIIVGISGDPLGRALLPDYAPLVLVGLERSPALKTLWKQGDGFDADVAYMHRAMIPIFASDQDEFHAQGVPGVWFITPGMSFYHTVDDAAETIDYRVMLRAGRYILQMIHLVAEAGTTFDYTGAPELAVEHANEVRVLLDGAMASDYPNERERAQLQGYLDKLDEVVEQGSFEVVGNPVAWFAGAVAVVALALPQAYPGPVPPPFPQ